MTWSTVDGKEHDGKPNNKLSAMQLGRQQKREEKAARKRQIAEQLAEARAKKRLRDSLADDTIMDDAGVAGRTKEHIQRELAANLLLIPNYQVQLRDVFDLGMGRDNETHNVGDIVFAAKLPPSNDMHWATIIEVNVHVVEDPSHPTLYNIEFDDGIVGPFLSSID